MATIERTAVDPEQNHVPDYKRCHVPGFVVVDKCPKCGREARRDLNDDYISYPDLNKPTGLGMYCPEPEDGGCGNDWKVPVIVEMTLRLA